MERNSRRRNWNQWRVVCGGGDSGVGFGNGGSGIGSSSDDNNSNSNSKNNCSVTGYVCVCVGGSKQEMHACIKRNQTLLVGQDSLALSIFLDLTRICTILHLSCRYQ